jgi:hypothetical protein
LKVKKDNSRRLFDATGRHRLLYRLTQRIPLRRAIGEGIGVANQAFHHRTQSQLSPAIEVEFPQCSRHRNERGAQGPHLRPSANVLVASAPNTKGRERFNWTGLDVTQLG